MTTYDIMYLLGGAIGLTCLAIFFDPITSLKARLTTIGMLLTAFFVAAYIVLGDSPVPENPMFPIQLKF